MTSTLIQGNVATVDFPPGLTVSIRAKTNSQVKQRITVKDTNGAVDLLFTGYGERNTTIGQSTFISNSKMEVEFEYENNGEWRNSSLDSGGPYEIGRYNLMVIVAENGDDSDYNDSMVEFSWYTPK